ncbi:MAG TPA: DUF1631 family protein [Rhodocyclaceae bacterium]|nr:DUF1631 family protein [Rhodocyclaceae bacterium]
MVTVAPDNVVQFPEGTRSAIGGRDRARTLRDSRDLVAHKLREGVRGLLAELQDDLAAKGDAADERDQRNFYYGGRELLRESVMRVEGLAAAHWLRQFDAATASGTARATKEAAAPLDELQLVDLGDMDEQIAVKALAGRLHDGCEEALFAAARRLAHLAGDEERELTIESMISDAVDAALKEAALPVPLRLEVLAGIERRVVKAFGPVIHDLNSFMVGRRVLPTLRRTYTRTKSGDGKSAKESGRPAPVDLGDVFANLQRLMPSAAAGATGTSRGAPGGVPMSPEAMAATMERVMVSLDTLQRAAPPAAVGAPNTNVLRDFRESQVGQGLEHIDAVTVDIVATLFDFIFDDPSVSDPIKALVGRLQIPVLKVAMLDKSFFSSKQHPARRLLDSISRAAARCGPKVGHEDPLYAHLFALIERLQTEFRQDARLFDVLCSDLNDFLERQEQDADARAVKAAPLVAEQERRELAAVAADGELAIWLSKPLPSGVADLLTHEWRALLVRHYLADDQAGWESAIATAGDLVGSTEPVADAAGRKALAAKLPTLVKRIHDGLDQAQVTMERRVSVLDCLFSIHAAVLRGAAPVVMEIGPQLQMSKPELVRQSIETEDAQLQSMSLVDSANVPVMEGETEAQQKVDDLQRGDWVEFPGGESGTVRYRLSWVSPERGILLFTNPQSPRALSVAPAALAIQIERGEAAIVPVEPIFDRAVNRALQALKAA